MSTTKPSVRQRFRAWLDKHKTTRSALQFVAFVVFLVVLFLIVTLPLLPIMWPNRTWLEGFQRVWLVVMGCYVLVLVLAGLFSQHRHPLGMLITKENRLSFSRLQMLCWWVLLVSALVVVAGARLQHGWLSSDERNGLANCPINQDGKSSEACAELKRRSDLASGGWLNIVIPDGLLLAAGLSTGAAAVKSSINGVKRNPSAKQASELDEQTRAAGQRYAVEYLKANLDPARVVRQSKSPRQLKMAFENLRTYEDRHGILKVAEEPALNQFVRGNEVGNWEDLDWSKVQALLLTAVLIVLYGIALWRMLSAADTRLMSETVSFPDFSGALAALLTVSLGGYAGYQAVNHSTVDTASVKSLRERTTDMDKEAPGATSVGRVNKTGSKITSYVSGSTFDLGQYDPGADFSDKRVVFKVSQNGKSAETVSALDS